MSSTEDRTETEHCFEKTHDMNKVAYFPQHDILFMINSD